MRIKPGASAFALLAALLLFTVPAFAAETTSNVRAIEAGGGAGVAVIEVSGNAEVTASPDVAYLSLSVETHAPTAEAASSQNATLAHKVVDALKAKLTGKGKISTGGYSLSPEYSAQPIKPGFHRPEIVGYVARNSILVETGELHILGSLIDSAIAAGANHVNYLNFGLHNDAKARSEAIVQASKDAQAQARALAASLGVKLGRVLRASTTPELRPVPLQTIYAERAVAGNVATPVEPGQITVRATVSLTYEIQ